MKLWVVVIPGMVAAGVFFGLNFEHEVEYAARETEAIQDAVREPEVVLTKEVLPAIETAVALAGEPAVSHTPVRIQIPSIKLNSPVVPVGINKKGEMDVPSGKTNNVGWYKGGTKPGEQGSAVMDAHVYAAFKKLKYAKVGDTITITTDSGRKQTFVIRESMLYRYDEVPPYYLFERADAKRLNLITCAGTYSKKLKTYTHRLVVYAELVEEN